MIPDEAKQHLHCIRNVIAGYQVVCKVSTGTISSFRVGEFIGRWYEGFHLLNEGIDYTLKPCNVVGTIPWTWYEQKHKYTYIVPVLGSNTWNERCYHSNNLREHFAKTNQPKGLEAKSIYIASYRNVIITKIIYP